MIEGLHHVSIVVSDLERSKWFYGDVLGLAESKSRPAFPFPGAWYETGGGQLHLIVHDEARTTRGTRDIDTRDGHFAFRVSDANAVRERLDAFGWAYADRPHSITGWHQLFATDPDGNVIEFNSKRRTIAFLFAHPDDETFSSACAILRAVREGHRVALLIATDGEAGKSAVGDLTPERLAAVRRQEMNEASRALGISEVAWLGYPDGKLSEADPEELARRIAAFADERGAEVWATFPEDGANGHPDHVAVHRAVRLAIDRGYSDVVRKVYYASALTSVDYSGYATIEVDVRPHWDAKKEALLKHASQRGSVEKSFGPELLAPPKEKTYERFVLAWERGKYFPLSSESKERFFFDRL